VSSFSDSSLFATSRYIGDYEVLTTLGRGGMGRVFLARKRVVGDIYREYALKLVNAGDEYSDFHRVLMEEAKLAARIVHPNVVSVVEVGEHDDGIYLVMDYVDGVNLSMLVKMCRDANRELPLRVAARILHDALAGLNAAHELRDGSGDSLGVVHRDFSPQNLIVGVDGSTRLTDFGIAKARSRADTTQSGQVKGKIGYMAPEQAMGQALDRRADVWAAGVVAWEAISGKRLFEGDTDAATIIRIVTDPEIPPLFRERPELPLEVHEAVVTALQTDRDRRCPSAGQLRRQLEAAWRAGDGIGELEEVAALVREVAADKLDQRRRRIAAAELRRTPEEFREETRNAMEAPVRTGARRSMLAWMLIVLVLVLVGAAGLSYRAGILRLEGTPAVAQGELVPQVDVPAPRPAPPPAPAATSSAPAPDVLMVRADVDLKEVWLDGKQLLLSSPSKEVRVQLPADAGSSLTIMVVARDGRRGEQRVATNAGEVAFRLGPQRPAVRKPDDRLLPYRPSR
jgi:serine/threonine-protein kinase